MITFMKKIEHIDTTKDLFFHRNLTPRKTQEV